MTAENGEKNSSKKVCAVVVAIAVLLRAIAELMRAIEPFIR